MYANEYLIEHNLTHNITIEQQQRIGRVDFNSPVKSMIQQETSFEQEHDKIMEDATDCARKLNFFKIAREACTANGIHRKNANASIRISSAVSFYCNGEKLETIGSRISKGRQAVSRYNDRFVLWGKTHGIHYLNTFTPENVIDICTPSVRANKPLSDILDEFRQQLTDLFFDLIEASEHICTNEYEAYLETSEFQSNHDYPINVKNLLNNF